MPKQTRRRVTNERNDDEPKRAHSAVHNTAHSTEELEHEAQRKYLQLQMMKQQLSTFAEEKKIVDEKIDELGQTIETIKKLDGVEKDSEMWTPLGSGAFVKSALKDTDNVLVAVGAGTAVHETRHQATVVLDGRKKELESLSSEVMGKILELSEAAESIETDLNKIIEKLQK